MATTTDLGQDKAGNVNPELFLFNEYERNILPIEAQKIIATDSEILSICREFSIKYNRRIAQLLIENNIQFPPNPYTVKDIAASAVVDISKDQSLNISQ